MKNFNLLISKESCQPDQEERADLVNKVELEGLPLGFRQEHRNIRLDRILKIFIFSVNSGLILSYFIMGYLAWKQDLLWRADYTAFYTGGSIVRDGLIRDLYNPQLQESYQKDILDGRMMQDGVLLFINPPFTVFIFAILSVLPLSSSYWVWAFFQLIFLGWLVVLLFSLSNSWSKTERALMISGALALHSLMLNFILGALSLFLLVCLFSFYKYLKNGNDAVSGIILTLSSFKPQNSLLFVFLLLGSRRWKIIAYAFGVLLPAVLITLAIGGWKIWVDYFRLLINAGNYFDQFGINPEAMHNFKGFLTVLFGAEYADIINKISWLLFSLSGVVILFLWKSSWNPHHLSFDLRFGFTVLAGLLFSPHLYPQDSLLIVLPAVLFYNYMKHRRRCVKVLAAFLLSCPLLFVISEYTFGSQLGIRIPTLVMILLLVWMGIMLVEEKKRSADQVVYGASADV